ncbi:ABC transporter ATP-binding protein [Mesoplasma syrphidae]|uniref:ABC transporter ATP-binding protein n=1 Tax=Mesoplasma syrphidae TaxID=225999 RepID=A0A2K9BJW3_9MOLU|nr:ATP-binding cassette domain-containing protein [Mesoplasma syrphidae]AUF83556.1 ABC transporter ATP-binding protein [Mesoplasma syrphidae]
MIIIENLKYSINPKISNLELDIQSLKIDDGDVVAFLGENGSGKTTLIDIIIGNLRPQKGQINFIGEEPIISAVFQDSFFDEIAIEETLLFFKRINNSEINITDLLFDFELLESRFKLFSELSFSQKQRFRFIVALIKPFSILILDEVMTGIDLVWKSRIRNVISEIIKMNKTVIIISHEIEDVASFCNKVVYFEKGKIKQNFKLTGSFESKKNILFEKINYLKEIIKEKEF